ncbi:MAG: alanine--glyoxylate aminotransferase family protein [Planctomycetes bacterium]|nr:alanine--glyoxylate aminotransferase family protein [Planctomycetota bacterium]
MSSTAPRLFIPGPTEVKPEVLAQMARPLISHRGPEIATITREIFAGLQRLFGTTAECFVASASATGLMEGVARNLVAKKALVTVCGAFSERQYQVMIKNGKAATALRFEPGNPVQPEAVARALTEDDYDLVTTVHSETSTGVLNPVAAIAEVVRKHPGTFLAVDCVSSLAGAPFEADAWGVDCAFAGTQKCLALPPGLALFTVSPRAMDRAATLDDRGHYFDFLNYRKMAARGQSPATINIPLMVTLHFQLGRIFAEGLEARFARHEAMATLVRESLQSYFPVFPPEGFRTPSESVFANPRGLAIAPIVDAMLRRGKVIGNGYGDLKEKTFRIGHLGDLTPEDLKEVVHDLREIFRELGIDEEAR